MRASGVFTGTTNSPSRSPRQSFDRYAIRAGRNLPDKEFRSVSLTLFPEKPDFLLHFLCSWSKLSPLFLQCLPLSNAFPDASGTRSFGTSRSRPSSWISAHAVQRRERSFRLGDLAPGLDTPSDRRDFFSPLRSQRTSSVRVAVECHVDVGQR